MCAWRVSGSCSQEEGERLLIPPSIGNSGMGGSRPVIVTEKANLMLTCAASGHPEPVVAWSRWEGW